VGIFLKRFRLVQSESGSGLGESMSREWYWNNREKILARLKANYDPVVKKEKNKLYYEKNRERCLESVKRYREEHREDKLKYLKKWRCENKDYMKKYRCENNEKINSDLRKMRQIKRDTDVNYRIRQNIGSRLAAILRQKSVIKKNHMVELLGCDVNFFRRYIEKQLQMGMTWDNYGLMWWLDHRIPVNWFDLSTEEGQREAFNFTNCKPMFKTDNVRKCDHYAEPSLVQIFNKLEVK